MQMQQRTPDGVTPSLEATGGLALAHSINVINRSSCANLYHEGR
jgi:hypothetical protein